MCYIKHAGQIHDNRNRFEVIKLKKDVIVQVLRPNTLQIIPNVSGAKIEIFRLQMKQKDRQRKKTTNFLDVNI